MHCPCCKKAETCVIDSRDINPDAIRRRRECSICGYRFTTYERIEPVKLMVVKKNGEKEPYQRSKIINGVSLAIEKRNITPEQVEEIADRIEQELLKTQLAEVTSAKIGKLVLEQLCQIDKVACLRFSSVYKEFSSLKSFERELTKLQNQTK